MIASLKLHWPDFLDAAVSLTFGRVRTMHLNLVIYGWSSLAGIAIMIWVMPRMFHTALRYPRSEEHTSELQSLMRLSYAVLRLKKKIPSILPIITTQITPQ